jgi:transcriptional regulator with XRE-family HTH domain
VDTFQYVGETLRRLRKESGLTLEEISAAAGLGRGQLSRIENGHQSATLKTLAKVLAAQGVSRAEFFRRYDLVEAEQAGASATSPAYLQESTGWPTEVREVLSRVESFFESAFPPQQGIAQGAVELGEYLVVFRVLPRGTTARPAPPSPAPRGSADSSKPKRRRRARDSRR